MEELRNETRNAFGRLSIHCELVACPMNRAKTCALVSGVRIDAEGKCETREKLTRKRQPTAGKVVCVACGLEIAQNARGQWYHTGVVLRHPPLPP